jgi:hypothetical protein
MVLALMNAPIYTKAEALRQVHKQTDSLGSNFFVTPAQLQEMVLHESLFGVFARRHLDSILIRPTPITPTAAAPETPKERREREVNKAYSK